MPGGSEHHRTTETVPLQNAVLCVDCESVSTSPCDTCPVCSSHSLLSLARMLGGPLASHKANRLERLDDLIVFDLNITVGLKRIHGRDLSVVLEGITTLIAPRLGPGRASFHVQVEPVGDDLTAYEVPAA